MSPSTVYSGIRFPSSLGRTSPALQCLCRPGGFRSCVLFALTLLLLTSDWSQLNAQSPSPSQPATWIRGAQGTANLTAGNLGALTKSAGGSSSWNAGAVASQRILRDGAVVFTAGVEGSCDFAIGLNLVDSSELNTDIDHAIRLKADSKAQVYHGATAGADLGLFSSSTVFMIRRSGAVVKFFKDGQLMHISTTPSAGPLLVDCSFYKLGSRLTSCLIEDGDQDADGLPDDWETASLPVNAGWADLMAFLPRGNFDGPPRPGSTDTATNRQEFDDGSLAGNPLSFLQPVTWQFHAGTQPDGTDGGLRKFFGSPAFDSEAISAKPLREDGKLSFKVPAPAALAVGLNDINDINDSRSEADFEWAFILAEDGTFDIQRLPDSVTDLNLTGPLGGYTAQTVFSIERVSGRVNFLKDGVLVYASTNASSGPLYVDCSLKTPACQISSVRLYTGDLDDDGLPDAWELFYLSAGAGLVELAAFAPGADPDSDGITNLDEYLDGTHPLQALISPAAVSWRNTNNVGPVSGSPGGAVKFGPTAWTNADAQASRTIYQTGRLTFRVKSGSALAVGFTIADNNRSYTDQEYSLQFNAAGQVFAYEGNGSTSSAQKASLGAYDSSTHFALRRVGGQVEFLKNNIVYYTAALPVSTPLFVDASFYTPNSEIRSAFLYTGDLDDDLMPDDWEIGHYQRKYGRPPTFAQLRDGFTPAGDEDGDGFGNRDEYFCGTDPLQQLIKPEAVVWRSLAGTYAIPGTRGGLRKSTTTAGYNADATSEQYLIDQGGFLFHVPANGTLAVGLTGGDNSNSNTDLLYAYSLTPTGSAIHKNGVVVLASVGTYTEATAFGIRRNGSVVEFLRDGVVVHTSNVPAPSVLYADCSLNTVYSILNNHRIASALHYNPAVDQDKDGLPDAWELQTGQLPLNATLQDLTQLSKPGSDADGDGLTLAQEWAARTSPSRADTDGDGLPDGWEVRHGQAPNDPGNATMDTDSDGLTNLTEFQIGTSPANPDSDADQMPDGYEVAHGLMPMDATDADSDKDGDQIPNLWEYARKRLDLPGQPHSASDPAEHPAWDAIIDPALSVPDAAAKRYRTFQQAYASLPSTPGYHSLVKVMPGRHLGVDAASTSSPLNIPEYDPAKTVAWIATSGASRISWTEGAVVINPYWLIHGDHLFRSLVFESDVSHGHEHRIVTRKRSVKAGASIRFLNCLFRNLQSNTTGNNHGGAITNQGAELRLEHCTLFRCNSVSDEVLSTPDGTLKVTRGLASIVNAVDSGTGSLGRTSLSGCVIWDDWFPAGLPVASPDEADQQPPSGYTLQNPVTGPDVYCTSSLIQGGMQGSRREDPMLNSKGYLTAQSTACLHSTRNSSLLQDLQGQARSRTPTLGAVEWVNQDTGTETDSLPDWWERWWFGHLQTRDPDITDPGLSVFFPPLPTPRPPTALEHYLAFSKPLASLDGDHLRDDWEIMHFHNLDQTDAGNPDGDSRDNLQEQTDGTDPTQADDNPDSDTDGLPDAWERQYFTVAPQPPEPTPDPLRFDANDDPDGDGLNNQQELTLGTAPNSSDAVTDVDNDGLPDAWERLYFKTQADIVAQTGATDFDMDGLNNLEEFQKKTNPLDSDTDDDGMPDGWEVQYGLSPLSVGGSHGAQGDPDGDTLKNLIEYQLGTSPTNADTDGDLLPDWWEVRNRTSLISNLGQDGPTGDIDHDGFTNLEEYRVLSDPRNASSYPGSGEPAQTFGESGTNTPDSSFAAFLAYRGRWLSFRSTLTHYYPYVIEKIYYEREVPNSSPPPLNDGFNGDADPNENLQDPGDPRDIPDWMPTYWIDCDEGSPGAIERIGTQPDYLQHSPDDCWTWEEFKESIYTVKTAYPGESGKLEVEDTSVDFSRSTALAAMESLPIYQGSPENGWMGDGRGPKTVTTVTSQWNVPYEVIETRECDLYTQEQSWPYKYSEAYMDQIQMRYQCNQPAPAALIQTFVLVKRETALSGTFVNNPVGPETVTVLGSMELRIEEGQMTSSQASATFPLPEGVTLQGGTILLTSPPVAPGTRASYDLLPVEVVNASKTPVSELKVGKMADSGVLSNTGTLNIDSDSDRFFIRIPGAASLGASTVKLETVENPDTTNYNDNATEIELTPQGGDLISKSLLLVSDDVDDNFPVDGIADDAKNDRTHKIQLDGKVKISAIKIGTNAEQVMDMKVPVKVKKTVKVRLTNCQYGIPFFKGPCWSSGDVTSVKKSLKERYAQVGVKLEITDAVGPDLGLSGWVAGYPFLAGLRITIPQETKDIFDAAPATSSDEIVLYLIRRCEGAGAPRGCATPEKYLTDADKSAGYGNKALVSPPSYYGDLFTAPHEALHLLLDSQHSDFPTEFADLQMLWHPTNHNGTIDDTKRISPAQETKVHTSPLAK